jgi:hypothetical protein
VKGAEHRSRQSGLIEQRPTLELRNVPPHFERAP